MRAEYLARHAGGATHSTSAAVNAGLDIDMPDNGWFSQRSIHGELDKCIAAPVCASFIDW